MMICPLCEHVQERGTVCDICGKQLLDPRKQPVQVAPLEGLETGKLGSADLTGRVSEESEAGAMSQNTIVPPRDPFTMEELGGADILPPEKPPVRCRMCGQFQPADSVTCSICGSRLPRLFPTDGEMNDHGNPEEKVTCRHCGVHVLPANGLCPSCGARISA